MLKKLIFSLLAVCILTGCANSDNILNIAPKVILPQKDPALMAITISINGADQRQYVELAKVSRNGKLVALTASRDLRFLLQEVLEKQMISRGYMVSSDGLVGLQIIINYLHAKIQEGNLRHNITAKADISIIAQGRNGSQQTKNYRFTYNVQGLFSATNTKISDAINVVLSDLITDMSQDTSISSFVKQSAHLSL
ncbi:YajG family lipoprotein [Candidatus Fukatsuia anoeciicola]|uniref:YajG family lipoprotein n=1 Tax=Candidatus Fukatsuia anoeciicola TaxID=2994492 RepID=UPI003464D85A